MCATAGAYVTEQQVKSLAINIFLGYVVESNEAWGKKTINQLTYMHLSWPSINLEYIFLCMFVSFLYRYAYSMFICKQQSLHIIYLYKTNVYYLIKTFEIKTKHTHTQCIYKTEQFSALNLVY